jgi:hypothetical protein
VSRHHHRSFILATELLLLAAGLFSCSSPRDHSDDVRREVEAIERKIVPLDAQVLARTEPVQTNWSVTASWDIETTMGRVEYSKWVTSQFLPEFKVVRADESQLIFSKQADGDTHSIECQFTPAKGKLHVHVAFSAQPD